MSAPMNQDINPVSASAVRPSQTPSKQWTDAQEDRNKLRKLLIALRDQLSEMKSRWQEFTDDKRFDLLTTLTPQFTDYIDDVLNFLRLPISGEEDTHLDKMVELDPHAHTLFHFLASGILPPYVGPETAESELSLVLSNLVLYRAEGGLEVDMKSAIDNMQRTMEDAKDLYSKVETISNKFWEGMLQQLKDDVADLESSVSSAMDSNGIDVSTICEYLQLEYTSVSLWTRRTAQSVTRAGDGESRLSDGLALTPTAPSRTAVRSWLDSYFGPGTPRSRRAPGKGQ